MIQQIIKQLVSLQHIDNQIVQIDLLKGNIPIEVQDIEDNIQRIKVKMKREYEKFHTNEITRNKLELDIASATEKLQQYEKKQLEVRNSREFNSIVKEMELQQDLIDSSKEELYIMDIHKEEYEKKKEVYEQELKDLSDNYAKKSQELKVLNESTSQKKEYLITIREEVIKEVDPRYLKIYERLRKGYIDKMAVVPMEKGAAMGISLPPQKQVEIRQKNKLIIDEHSGRIVVDPSFFEEAAQTLTKKYKL